MKKTKLKAPKPGKEKIRNENLRYKTQSSATKTWRGLLLLSGGFDSPVAGWMMQKKGFEVFAVHFSSKLITDIESEKKSRKLADFLGIKKLFVIDISKELIKISKTCEHRYYFVLMKRMMYRIAEKIAKREKCKFLITGENLAQVSSQTLQNLSVIDKATKLEVLRPLLGFDKQEIMDLAKKIGTYETSCGPEHCDALGPAHPATRAREDDILREEAKLDII